jgi:hypothetical protein
MDFNIKKRAPEKAEQVEKVEPVEQKKYEATLYTQDEQDKLLIGYDSVSDDAWPLLRAGTHIRYITKDGKFRRGGFVHNVAKVKGKQFIFVETLRGGEKTPGYAKFPVAIEDISVLYKKRTVEDVRINENNTTEIENRIIALETNLEHAVSEIKKLIAIVAKLNEKIVRQPMVARMPQINENTK